MRELQRDSSCPTDARLQDHPRRPIVACVIDKVLRYDMSFDDEPLLIRGPADHTKLRAHNAKGIMFGYGEIANRSRQMPDDVKLFKYRRVPVI